MSDIDKFWKTVEKLELVVTKRVPSASMYLQKLAEQDAYLANRLLTAARGNRRFHVSISDRLGQGDAFFKTTGLDNADRLLAVSYPLNAIDFDEAASLLNHWIILKEPEIILIGRFKSLF